jgi:hypothetical protein
MFKQKIKIFIKKIPLLRLFLKNSHMPMPANFTSSRKYWEDRYNLGGDSGAGSYSKLARFKAGVCALHEQRHTLVKAIIKIQIYFMISKLSVCIKTVARQTTY